MNPVMTMRDIYILTTVDLGRQTMMAGVSENFKQKAVDIGKLIITELALPDKYKTVPQVPFPPFNDSSNP